MTKDRILAMGPGLAVLAVALAVPAAGRDRQLGTSVQANIAAMAVDLDPAYAGVKMEGTNGVLAERAVTRYRNGQVTPLRSISGDSEVGGNAQQRGGPAAAGAQGPR